MLKLSLIPLERGAFQQNQIMPTRQSQDYTPARMTTLDGKPRFLKND